MRNEYRSHPNHNPQQPTVSTVLVSSASASPASRSTARPAVSWLCLALLVSSCGEGSETESPSSTRPVFDAGEFELLDAYEPPAGNPASSAIAADDARLLAWATGFVAPIALGVEVDEGWDDPMQALGVAEGNTDDVFSIGNGGTVTLTFDVSIGDGVGPDFAVFENSFDDYFLELAFVEVSSNGEDFQRFDCAYLGDEPVGQYDTHDTELIGGLAGKYRVGYGTPFDLAQLRDKPSVSRGDLDLDAITQVRIVDIVGDGSQEDSFGHPIYDPTPTVGSGGFDLDGIGVINTAD